MPGDVIKIRTALMDQMRKIVIKRNVTHGCSIAEMVVVFIKHGNAVRKSIRNATTHRELTSHFLFKMVTTIVRTKRTKKIVTSQRLQIYRMYQT